MSITVTGLTELYHTLDRAASLDILEPPMKRGQYRLQAYMQDYPARPSQSRYVRTGTLGRRWTVAPVDRTVDGISGKIGNNTAYAPFVQSEQLQVRTHRRTGWRTDAQAVRENEAAIVADFQQAVDAATRS
jgi:hypothetical protein